MTATMDSEFAASTPETQEEIQLEESSRNFAPDYQFGKTNFQKKLNLFFQATRFDVGPIYICPNQDVGIKKTSNLKQVEFLK